MSARYSILLPADTPLFVHLRHAVETLLPREYAELIDVEVFAPQVPNRSRSVYSSHSPNDRALAKHLSATDHYLSNGVTKTILAGVCDAHVAKTASLAIEAAVVRRLTFAGVASTKLSNHSKGMSKIKRIYAHGRTLEENAAAYSPSSSAQALAKCIAYRCASHPCEITIRGIDYNRIPTLDDESILLTSNIPALYSQSTNANVMLFNVADVFPEWAPVALSALATPRNPSHGHSKEHHKLLDALLEALHVACCHLRTYPDKSGLEGALRLYYNEQILDEAHARWVARWLIGNRVIPNDIEISDYGLVLASCLWNQQMPGNDRALTQSLRARSKGSNLYTPSERTREAKGRALNSIFDKNVHARITARIGATTADVVIICPTDGEADALKACFEDVRPVGAKQQGGIAELGFSFGTSKRRRGIIVSMNNQMGRVAAATIAMRVIPRWRPSVLILSGIAGGFRNKVKLGSVLVVGKAIDYELQKDNPRRNRVDYDIYKFDADLVREAKAIYEMDWEQLIKCERPGGSSTIMKPDFKCEGEKLCIFSGDKISASPRIARKHLSTWGRSIGIEMESAGIGGALRALEGEFEGQGIPKFLMIRAVSDLASKDKSGIRPRKGPDNKSLWRKYACNVAAAFTAKFILEHFENI